MIIDLQAKDKSGRSPPIHGNTVHTCIIHPFRYTLVNLYKYLITLICSFVVIYQQQSITPKLVKLSCTIKGCNKDLPDLPDLFNIAPTLKAIAIQSVL